MRVLFAWYEWVLRRLAPKANADEAEMVLYANYEKAYGSIFLAYTMAIRDSAGRVGPYQLYVYPRSAVGRLDRSARAGRFVA